MKLINLQTGEVVEPGQALKDFRGDDFTLLYGQEPRNAGSTGRVVVLPAGATTEANCREFFPSVVGCKFVADTEVVQ